MALARPPTYNPVVFQIFLTRYMPLACDSEQLCQPSCTAVLSQTRPFKDGVRDEAENGALNPVRCLACQRDAPDRPQNRPGPKGKPESAQLISGQVFGNRKFAPFKATPSLQTRRSISWTGDFTTSFAISRTNASRMAGV